MKSHNVVEKLDKVESHMIVKKAVVRKEVKSTNEEETRNKIIMIINLKNKTRKSYVECVKVVFGKIGADKSCDDVVTELKHLPKNCYYCDYLCESLLRDKADGIVDKETRKMLLQIINLTLELCLDTSRAYEASRSQIAAIPDAFTVHRFRTSKPKPAQTQYKPNVIKCHFCGKQHKMLKPKCPVYGKTCKACNQKNIFSVLQSVIKKLTL